MSWSPDGPQGFESRKIKYLLPRYTRGRGLEIGCGMEKAFPHFIGVDNGHHFGKGAADVVANADDLSLFASESMDFVFSSHVLEHMEDMGAALNEWCRLIKPGGFLCLYVPSANLYPKCGEPGANPDHKHDIYPGDIIAMLDDSPYWFRQVEAHERSAGDEYSLFEVYEKLRTDDGTDADCVTIPLPTIRTVSGQQKRACVCRFGGFGDMLQAATVFPQLKKQGFHVTVMTTPKGMDVIRHDPHVDDWYIVDQDQVPNQELGAFWTEQAKGFDRFVNLSESVEGTLLAIPGRINHTWSHRARKKRLNVNYHEFTAELADVEFAPARLFWPTNEEELAAAQRIDDGQFNVLWALSGSSPHKTYPHQDAVIARILLEIPEARLFLVGDEACRVLEQGWQAEPRVTCLSGQLSIRETLALAQQVDLVIGPETGVLNAVGMDETPHKILLLSHSSHNNLCKHWENVQSMTPDGCPCYPCHRLHYGMEHCHEAVIPVGQLDGQLLEAIAQECPESVQEGVFKTGSAACAYAIAPGSVFAAVEKVCRNWRKGKLS